MRTRPPTHPGRWKSYVFRAKLYYYIIAISKQVAAWLCHLRGQRVFSGGKFTEVLVGRAYQFPDPYPKVCNLEKRKAWSRQSKAFSWPTLISYNSQISNTSILRNTLFSKDLPGTQWPSFNNLAWKRAQIWAQNCSYNTTHVWLMKHSYLTNLSVWMIGSW